ncbi:hypothetical protein WP12_03725 [Sphingomonas sp. SRS2]|nr:hypothetical protein WP12_03725 [Sphingomonas sp. SRS2]
MLSRPSTATRWPSGVPSLTSGLSGIFSATAFGAAGAALLPLSFSPAGASAVATACSSEGIASIAGCCWLEACHATTPARPPSATAPSSIRFTA